MDMFSFLLGRSSGGGGKGSLKVLVVEELPETGEANTLYLVPRQVSKYRNVFDEYLWINETWEMVGTTDIDISGKQDKMQFTTLPTANADNLGKIYQYVGTTNANYTNGYFYICVSDGEATPTYSWVNLQVQDGDNDKNIITYKWNDTSTNAYAKVGEAITNGYGKGVWIYIEELANESYTGYETKGQILFNSIGQQKNTYGFRSQYLLPYSNYAQYISVVGSWTNNIYTVSRIDCFAGGIAKQALLTNNTTSYTPSSDYNPATKKYVDDAISLVGGFPQTVYLLTLEKEGTQIGFETQAFTTLLNQIGTKSSNEYCVLVRSKKAGTNYYNVALASFDRNLSTTNQAILQFLDLPITGQHNSIHKYSYKVGYTYSNGEYTNVSVLQHENITILTSDNTEAYTPTANSYNPATTKYVDSAITSAITTTLGGNY